MMKKIIIASYMITLAITGIAQEQNKHIVQIQNDIKEIRNELSSSVSTVEKNKRSISVLSTTISSNQKDLANLKNDMEHLNSVVSTLDSALKTSNNNLSSELQITKHIIDTNKEDFSSELKTKSIYCAITLLIVIFTIAFIFLHIRKRISLNGSIIDSIKDAQDKLKKAQSNLEEESIKLDNKLIELIEKQLDTNNSKTENSIDHSLALKVADEIVRIEINLSRMDSSIKGYKQLTKAVERIKNNFLAKGYEITDLLNKPYNEGMRIHADFAIDESLAPGARIISSITKPEVLFNGEIIQKATVIVKQNI